MKNKINNTFNIQLAKKKILKFSNNKNTFKVLKAETMEVSPDKRLPIEWNHFKWGFTALVNLGVLNKKKFEKRCIRSSYPYNYISSCEEH